MYKVESIQHPQYGYVIALTRSEGGMELPFLAVQQAIKLRRLQKEGGCKKIRLLIDDQIMAPSQAENWAREEYHSLPKCEACAKILTEEVYTHPLCSGSLFCTQVCADKNYSEKIDQINDEEEIEL